MDRSPRGPASVRLAQQIFDPSLVSIPLNLAAEDFVDAHIFRQSATPRGGVSPWGAEAEWSAVAACQRYRAKALVQGGTVDEAAIGKAFPHLVVVYELAYVKAAVARWSGLVAIFPPVYRHEVFDHFHVSRVDPIKLLGELASTALDNPTIVAGQAFLRSRDGRFQPGPLELAAIFGPDLLVALRISIADGGFYVPASENRPVIPVPRDLWTEYSDEMVEYSRISRAGKD